MEACRTPGCDRVAARGLDRCLACANAFMEGEAAGSAGKLARLASKSPPLSPTMAKRLTELRWLLETSAPVALTVRMAQRHGIARQELMMLQEDGYILVTKRQGAGSPQITFLAPGRDATAKVARASEAVG